MLLFALLLLVVVSSAFFGFLRTRVPFVPTYNSDIKFILGKIKLDSNSVFYDLGSGDGSVVLLVEKLTGAKGVGFELTMWTNLLAKLKARLQGRKSKFYKKDFFKADWSEATVIYCYLYPPLMGRIEEKFKQELKPGGVAIVRDFPFPNMNYSEKYYLPKDHEIYIYRV